MSQHGKVVFLGLDAADPDTLLRGAEEGRFPVLRSLRRGAVWGTVRNPVGFYVGAVWPSFLTGASPARHGRYCYRQYRPGTYEAYRTHAEDLRAEPFWRLLGEAGRRVAVVDVPKSPSSRELNGVEIVDWRTHDPDLDGPRTHPAHLLDEIRARFAAGPNPICDVVRDTAGHAALAGVLAETTASKTRLCEYVLAQERWDLFLAVFAETHCAGHQLWHLHDPGHPRHEALGDPMLDVYAEVDRAVGRLVERLDGDTTLFVLASHGMGPHYDGNHLVDEVLRRLDGQPPAPLRRDLRAPLLRAWHATPPAVRGLLRPLRDRVVRAADEAPRRVDSRLRFFRVPNNDGHAAICINLAGREPAGRVRPSELEEVCARLEDEITRLVNPRTGRPAVKAIYRTARLYDGPCLGDLPDLVVEWSREAPIEALESPAIGRVEGIAGQRRTGDHRPEGLFFALGPGIEARRMHRPVSIMDFAPTVCALLGVAPRGMDGEVIGEIAGSGSAG